MSEQTTYDPMLQYAVDQGNALLQILQGQESAQAHRQFRDRLVQFRDLVSRAADQHPGIDAGLALRLSTDALMDQTWVQSQAGRADINWQKVGTDPVYEHVFEMLAQYGADVPKALHLLEKLYEAVPQARDRILEHTG